MICFALWNGRDPILKERLFGLTCNEGRHGEDVKEDSFFLDSTPTHSYMRHLYKYPQAAYPFEQLIREDRKRTRRHAEYELLDTGIFERQRYFDVTVEYGKGAPDDILIRITAVNRGDQAAMLDLLPTIWFRNTWAGGSTCASRDSGERQQLLDRLPGFKRRLQWFIEHQPEFADFIETRTTETSIRASCRS